jgi:hypothetical protein
MKVALIIRAPPYEQVHKGGKEKNSMIEQIPVENGIWLVKYSGRISREEGKQKPLDFIQLLTEAGKSPQYVLFDFNVETGSGSGNTMEFKPLIEIWRKMNGGTFVFLRPMSPLIAPMVNILRRMFRIKGDFKVIPNYEDALAYARALRDGKTV